MNIPFYHVDAFADHPFSGNPAAVCVLPEPRDAEWMQAVASEMNLSETAFLYEDSQGYRLRWFTPSVEVDLCGHATLAAAHALWTDQGVSSDRPLLFYTKSGELSATRNGPLIELDFPSESASEATAPPRLLDAMGISPSFIGKNRLDYILEIESEEALVSMQPDFAALREIPVRGIIVTSAAASDKYDFVSRFFAPAAGIDEDPVTGSAHCCLGPYWQRRLAKTEFVAFQRSRRGGTVHLKVKGDRVLLGGRAVTIVKGEFC